MYCLDCAISDRDVLLRLQRKVVYAVATHALPVEQHGSKVKTSNSRSHQVLRLAYLMAHLFCTLEKKNRRRLRN